MNIGNDYYLAIRGRTGPLLAALLVLGSVLGNAMAAELAPMKLYYNHDRKDNFTAVNDVELRNAELGGYRLARTQGYLLTEPRPGTAPVYLYWHGGRRDNFSVVTPSGLQSVRHDGYRNAGIQGYVYTTRQPGTVRMKLWWNGSRADNFSTVTADGEWAARAGGYRYVRTQGWVYPPDHPRNCLKRAQDHMSLQMPQAAYNNAVAINWDIPTRWGCEDLEVYYAQGYTSYLPNRDRVNPVDSRAILPGATIKIQLMGRFHGHWRSLAYRYLLRANVVSYAQAEDRWGSRDATEEYARIIFDNVGDYNLGPMLGWRVDIHVIPASQKITDLPRYEDLKGKPTDRDGGNRNYDDIRGAGGERDYDNKVIYMAVGEEMVQSTPGYPITYSEGYVLIHEAAHTVMGQHNQDEPKDWFMLRDHQGERLLELYDAKLDDPNFDWLGDEAYTKSSVEEYFAESVAAYFGFPLGGNYQNEYRPEVLESRDPQMYQLVDDIFRCDTAFAVGNPPTRNDPVCLRP